MLADAFTLAFSWFVIVNGYRLLGGAQYQAATYLRGWPTIVAFLAVNWFARLYQGHGTYPAMPLDKVEEFRRLILSAVLTHVTVIAVLGFLHQQQLVSRFALVAAGLMTAVLAQPVRNVVRRVLARLQMGQISAYLLGGGRAADVLERQFRGDPYFGFRIVRRFGRHEMEALLTEARRYGIKHIFCCLEDDRFFKCLLPQLADWFSYIEYLPTAATFPVASSHSVSVGHLGGLEMVNQRRLRLQTFEKSVIDCSLTLLILLCASPFFVLVPLLIKLTSRGPVFYRATRLGQRGRKIRVLKFRSMYADADRRLQSVLDADPALKAEFERDFKLRNDPRVTPLGRFLRKTSIDELPQLLNVLHGDMALVGPRPIVEREIAYYGEAYDVFSSVKPGITGLWQASGRSDCEYAERVALDVHYVLNWSPWMDLWIVARTVGAVLTMKGSC